MSSKWIVRDTNRDTEKPCDSRQEAEERKDDVVALGAHPDDIEIIPPGENEPEWHPAEECPNCGAICEHAGCPECHVRGQPETPEETDGGQEIEAEIVEHPEAEPEPKPEAEPETGIPENPPVDKDPVDWMPAHFVDEIQGVPTVNRKGYAVIAAQYGVSVTAEPVTLASDTEFEFAEFQAVAITEDGQEYSGFGSAHVDRQDGDDPHLLNELAETRALKRACAWATGVGMTAASEMM